MRQHINELVVTDGEQIICVPPQQDIQLAASLGLEKSHALAMFQALTGCDTASVLNLLDMDRKLHGMPAKELIARACYTACALTDIHEHNRATLSHVCAEDSTHTHCSGTACQECCLQGGHIWGQIRVSQPVLPSLVHGTRLIMDYMNHTGPYFQDQLQPVTCGMQERML